MNNSERNYVDMTASTAVQQEPQQTVTTQVTVIADPSANTVASFDYRTAMGQMTEEKRQEYLTKAKREIDIEKPSSIRSYGQDITAAVERISDKVLEMSQSTSDVASVQLTNSLIMELEELRAPLQPEKNKYWAAFKKLPVVRSIVKKQKEVSIERATPGNNVRKISEDFAALKTDSMSQTVIIEDMTQSCKEYIVSDREKVLAAMVLREEVKQKLDELENAEYVNLDELQHMRNVDSDLSKKITTMLTTEHLFQQNLVQLGILNGTHSSVIDRCEESQQLIPVVRSQVAIGILTDRNRRSVEHIKRFEEYTNNVLVENMTELEASSIEMARIMETPGVKAETLEQTKSKLINIIRNIKEIKANGEAQREQINETVARLREELNDAIRSEY